MPAVSVVMAVKNGEATVIRAINSFLSQTFTDFEFLIADDHSTDNTYNIINSIDDKRIKLLKANKSGLVAALNYCLKNATGKYIARMDADDYAYSTRLEKQWNALENNDNIGVISGQVKHISTKENQEGYAYHVNEINNIISPEQHFNNRFIDAPLANPSVMFRTTLIHTYGKYKDFEGPEDYEFWLRLLEYGVKFMKIPDVVLDWYDYDYRLTRNNNKYSIEAFYNVKSIYFAKWWNNQSIDKQIWVWGYGKDVFNKSVWLEKNGVSIEGYIDIKQRHTKRKTIIYNQIDNRSMFILVYVSDRTGRTKIKSWLDENNFRPSENYYFMA